MEVIGINGLSRHLLFILFIITDYLLLIIDDYITILPF